MAQSTAETQATRIGHRHSSRGSSWNARWCGGGLERTIGQGLEQTRAYMDRCGVEEGHLVVFDRTPGRTWEEKVFRREETGGEAPVTVWGM